MRELQRRADQLAQAQRRRAIRRIADDLSGKVRGAVVEAAPNEVVLRGKGLLARWLVDPGLRFIADMSR